jgi:hypothetical protein
MDTELKRIGKQLLVAYFKLDGEANNEKLGQQRHLMSSVAESF